MSISLKVADIKALSDLGYTAEEVSKEVGVQESFVVMVVTKHNREKTVAEHKEVKNVVLKYVALGAFFAVTGIPLFTA